MVTRGRSGERGPRSPCNFGGGGTGRRHGSPGGGGSCDEPESLFFQMKCHRIVPTIMGASASNTPMT